MQAWRFDQGRLDYFQIDEIKNIACALADMNGMEKPSRGAPDTIREILAHYSSLPFRPNDYYVWRNYGRVFECMMLATIINGRLIATDLCKQIAAGPDDSDSDDYLAHFSRNFYYSSPVFEDYNPNGPQIFPVVAIIKFLIAEYLQRGKNHISISEIGEFLIANAVTGLEDIDFFTRLRRRTLPGRIDLRQVRELVKVISQFSFLKWDDPELFIEVSNQEELFAIESAIRPALNLRRANAGAEILRMGSVYAPVNFGALTLKNVGLDEEEFTEGKKVRVTHLRSERSSKLKSVYFSRVNRPEICRMCELDTAKKYPWTSHVIELHHLLPLASPIRVEQGTTSIKDLVGLCPSCHRATHRYYSMWFGANSVRDFRSYAEAEAVYEEARRKIVVV